MCNIPSADMMIVNTNKDFTTIHVILSASYPSRYEYAAKSIDADSIIEVLKLVSSNKDPAFKTRDQKGVISI